TDHRHAHQMSPPSLSLAPTRGILGADLPAVTRCRPPAFVAGQRRTALRRGSFSQGATAAPEAPGLRRQPSVADLATPRRMNVRRTGPGRRWGGSVWQASSIAPYAGGDGVPKAHACQRPGATGRGAALWLRLSVRVHLGLSWARLVLFPPPGSALKWRA